MRILSVLIVLFIPINAAFSSQLAFVVGISNYAHITKLPNSQIDATAFNEKLSAAGYKTTLLLNDEASKIPFLQHWERFLERVRPGDDIVVYYSGHGVDVKGANYMVPQDILRADQIGGDVGKQSNLVAFRDLMQSLEDRAVGMQVWIIDACRSDPFQPPTRPIFGSGGLTGDISHTNRFILFSANYGQLALDRLPDDPQDATLGSPFSRILVSLFDDWKSRSIRDFAGELRERTIASVDPYPQFPVWEDGLRPIWCFTKCDESDIQKAITINNEAARKLAAMSQLIMRDKYPLAPNEIYYDVEYVMDQETLQGYAERIRQGFVRELRQMREGRGETSDNLADEQFDFVLTSEGWGDDITFRPGSRGGNDGYAEVLFEDATFFKFADSEGLDVTLMCSAPGLADALVTMPRTKDMVQRITVSADFRKRVFRKTVWCKDLARLGSDNIAFSAADLIGRTLTSDSVTYAVPILRELKSLFMRFAFDEGFLQSTSIPERAPLGRLIEFDGRKEVKVEPAHVGLAGVQLGGAP